MSVVRDDDFTLARPLCQLDPDAPARRGEFDGVGNQVPHDLLQAIGVGGKRLGLGRQFYVVEGSISGTSKVIVGTSGLVEGNISGKQADVVGKVSGNIKVSDLLQLRDTCIVNGNIYAAKLQIEPTATFNGECHMGANVVEMKEQNETITVAK